MSGQQVLFIQELAGPLQQLVLVAKVQARPSARLLILDLCTQVIVRTEIRIDGLHLFPAKGLSLLLGSSNNAMFVAFLQCG